MKRYSALYYLLFVLIIMGAFASMAQNSYGLKIVGIASLGFVLTFLNEIFFPTHIDHKLPYPSWLVPCELVLLTIVATIFFLRNFSIDITFFTPLLILSMVTLLPLLLYQALIQIRIARAHNTVLVTALVLYYASVFTFILSVLISILVPDLLNAFAVVGILLAAGFVAIAIISKKITHEGGTVSILQYIGLLKNKSSILLITCILLYGYHLLYSIGTLPPLYHGTVPEGYRRLVEMSIVNNDQKRPLEFKERYEDFVEKYSKDLGNQ